MKTFVAISVAAILAALTSLAVGQDAPAAPRKIDREDDIRKTYLSRLDPNSHTHVKPGDVITKENAKKVWSLVSPGIYWLVEHGMQMNIIEHTPFEDPPAYKEATEKYHAQVKLAADGVLDENTYVAGRPFPIIDANDPTAATKIMYNFERSAYFTDDLTSKLFDAETGSIQQKGAGQQYAIERHFVLEALRAIRYVGRTEQQPVPKMPNPDNVLLKGGSYPVLEPFDLKGVGGVSYRYLDPHKYDDTWLYLPSLRRVRRLSTAQRSDALFGQDIDLDTVGGFAGQIPWFDWKLLAVTQGLGVGHGKHLPGKPCEADGGVTFCDDWELGPGYIIEGTPKMAGYAYSKRILFVSAETFYIAYTDLFDQRGELWKTAINFGRYDKKPNPRASVEYPFPRTFLYGFVVVDIQLEHATRASIPGMSYPEEPGWFINQGPAIGIDDDWFTVAALIRAGR
jgi:hypothetical protein